MNHRINSMDELVALYGEVNPNSLAKETQSLTPQYRAWLKQAPFFALASMGDEGMDCSPRGDKSGEVLKVLDAHTLMIPDRRGNNRIDTLKNIVRDPRVAMMFMIPGINEALRINGHAHLSNDPALLAQFAVNEKLPACVIVVAIDAVYFQCARAMKRARLWDEDAKIARAEVPTAGQMTKGVSAEFDAESYDAALDKRQDGSLY